MLIDLLKHPSRLNCSTCRVADMSRALAIQGRWLCVSASRVSYFSSHVLQVYTSPHLALHGSLGLSVSYLLFIFCLDVLPYAAVHCHVKLGSCTWLYLCSTCDANFERERERRGREREREASWRGITCACTQRAATMQVSAEFATISSLTSLEHHCNSVRCQDSVPQKHTGVKRVVSGLFIDH